MDKKENKIPQTQTEEKKILIETSSDLYKLPLDVIKNTKIYKKTILILQYSPINIPIIYPIVIATIGLFFNILLLIKFF